MSGPATPSVPDPTRESERLTAVLQCIRIRQASSLRRPSRPPHGVRPVGSR